MDIKPLLDRKKLCEACTARQDAKQVVIPEITSSKVWVLGRNPGRNEDTAGKPFVGRGGGLLDSWFDILGYPRHSFFIENTLACYTKNDRQPLVDEFKACSYWLGEEIMLAKPLLIITLGNDALNSVVMSTGVKVDHLHGMLLPSRWKFARVFPTFHPGHCLRQKVYQDKVEKEDLPKLKQLLDNQYASYMAWRTTENKKEAIGAQDRRVGHVGGDR